MNNTEQANTGSLAATVIFAAALVLVVVVELLGNVMVLWVVYRQRRNIRQRVTNTLIANLACIDLLVPTFLFPFSISVLIEGRAVLTYAVCQINGFMNNLVGSASILTMAVIGIDRYLAIVFPPGRRLKSRQARFLLLCVWIISIVISLLPILFWGEYKATDKSTACKPESGSYLLFLAIVCFIIPLATMVYCYTKVFLKVRNHRKQLNLWKRNSCRIKSEFKTTKIVFVVLTTFIVAWAPFVIVYVLSSNMKTVSIPSGVTIFCGLLAAAHSMCNPIIYFTMNRAFRKDVIDLVPCLKSWFPRTASEFRVSSSHGSCCEKSNSLPPTGRLSTQELNKGPSNDVEVVALD